MVDEVQQSVSARRDALRGVEQNRAARRLVDQGWRKVMDYLWVAAVAIGPLLPGLAIAHALLSRRPLSWAERQRRRPTVERLYQKEPPSPERHSVR